MNVKDVRRYQSIFKIFDPGETGFFKASDIERIFDALGIQQTSKEAQSILNEIDVDNSGRIDFVEFVTLMTSLEPLTAETMIDDCFSLLDDRGSGLVQLRRLFTVMKAVGFTGTYDELVMLVQQLPSLTHSGRVLSITRAQFTELIGVTLERTGGVAIDEPIG